MIHKKYSTRIFRIFIVALFFCMTTQPVQLSVPAGAKEAMDRFVGKCRVGLQKGVDKAGEYLMQQQVQAQLERMSVRYGLMTASVGLYAAAVLLAGETLVDVCYGYANLKKVYHVTADNLRACKVHDRQCMSEYEVRVCAALQALSRVPREFWKEAVATGAIIGLCKLADTIQAKL